MWAPERGFRQACASQDSPKAHIGPGSSRLTPDALKRFAEEHKSCQDENNLPYWTSFVGKQLTWLPEAA